MKRLRLAFLMIGLLVLGGQASAELCTVDAVPAATLLVPYFEVNLSNPNGVTTLFSINNASAAPTIAHVVFWTDWSYPTVDFDIYLTGYDVVTVNVRDVFAGIIPITADAPNDPNQINLVCGDKSPCGGGHSQNRHWDDTDPVLVGEQGFPFCDQIFPGFNNPVIVGQGIDRLVNGHTGRVVTSLNNCVGFDHDDVDPQGGPIEVARGYITVDNASVCSLVLNPGGVGFGSQYFVDGGLGVANDINQLWGDWFLVDFANNFAQGETLVHIEADPAFNAASTPTGYTFYARYFPEPSAGPDNREPLGTTWATRFLNGGVFDQTQLIVWRDSTSSDIFPPANQSWCNNVGPSWFPLNENEVIAFNEAEDAVEICFFTGGVFSPPADEDPPCFPLETGRYNWGDAPLDVPFNFGWAFLNLNLPPDTPVGDHDFPPPVEGGPLAQSYVATIHSALGRFSVGLEAVELTDACENVDLQINGAIQNGGQNVIPFF